MLFPSFEVKRGLEHKIQLFIITVIITNGYEVRNVSNLFN